ncbi:MAG: peptidoglycan DD-metalloendopeptidase family protein [Nanoarchaeota archaeon]|nr:peptidoglycan DD-metalloendopeptidase family protein [Nanoarchaeota archaeon]
MDPKQVMILDFTSQNQVLNQIDLGDTEAFTQHVFNAMEKQNATIGIGRFNEDRTIYARSSLFSGSEARTVHLGIDIFATVGVPVFSPWPGRVHSVPNNNTFGDYGPTIVLEHELEGNKFYTLYGHLGNEVLDNLSPGQQVDAGQQIATIGNYPDNGNWPPHLHFQLMNDMQGRTGDFPGVCSIKDREQFLNVCINPNLILNIDGLE